MHIPALFDVRVVNTRRWRTGVGMNIRRISATQTGSAMLTPTPRGLWEMGWQGSKETRSGAERGDRDGGGRGGLAAH